MDSLANYGSDGENSDHSEDSKNMKGKITSSSSKEQLDDNYEPVQMEMSEESNNNNNNSSENNSDNERRKSQSPSQSCSGSKSNSSSKRLSSNHRNSVGDDKHRQSRGESGGDSKYERHRHEDKTSSSRRQTDDKKRDNNDSKNKKYHRNDDDDDDDRKSRDNERKKEKYITNKNDKKYDKFERDYRDDLHKEKKRDRDRRHSRSDRNKERHRDDINYRSSSSSSSSNYKDKRSRSRSKERTIQQSRPLSYREEKNRNKLAQLEKLGIELKTPDNIVPVTGVEPNYYNPLTASTQGKYAEQIQKRKLLWANKSKQDEGNKTAATVGSTNTWLGTTFTQDQDGKMTAKFKRLMGIKGEVASSSPAPGQKPDILKKQEEMFTNMEQQYEVARATTHTQRGVGLGYASGGYQFTR